MTTRPHKAFISLANDGGERDKIAVGASVNCEAATYAVHHINTEQERERLAYIGLRLVRTLPSNQEALDAAVTRAKAEGVSSARVEWPTRLRGVTARGVNLVNADLSSRDMRESIWADCDFSGANLLGTILDGADLSGCSARAFYATKIPSKALRVAKFPIGIETYAILL